MFLFVMFDDHYNLLQFGLFLCVRVDTRALYDWFYQIFVLQILSGSILSGALNLEDCLAFGLPISGSDSKSRSSSVAGCGPQKKGRGVVGR